MKGQLSYKEAILLKMSFPNLAYSWVPGSKPWIKKLGLRAVSLNNNLEKTEYWYKIPYIEKTDHIKYARFLVIYINI